MRFCDLTEKEVINVCDGPDINLVDIDEKEAKHKV